MFNYPQSSAAVQSLDQVALRGLNSGLRCPHVKLSLDETLRPELLPGSSCTSVSVNGWVWTSECQALKNAPITVTVQKVPHPRMNHKLWRREGQDFGIQPVVLLCEVCLFSSSFFLLSNNMQVRRTSDVSVCLVVCLTARPSSKLVTYPVVRGSSRYLECSRCDDGQ